MDNLLLLFLVIFYLVNSNYFTITTFHNITSNFFFKSYGRQWTIMKSLGIKEEDIPKFADPTYWINHFARVCMVSSFCFIPPYLLAYPSCFYLHVINLFPTE